jgi:hypothetical protein
MTYVESPSFAKRSELYRENTTNMDPVLKTTLYTTCDVLKPIKVHN